MSAGFHPTDFKEITMNILTQILNTHRKLTAVVAVTLAMLLLAFSLVFNTVERNTLAETMPAVAAVPQHAQEPVAMEAPTAEEFRQDQVSDDVLWLARVIYSETKRPYEQELVAWVIRNRVETKYRGQSTYKTVVLDPWQFSAFNKNGPKRNHYLNLNATSKAQGWATALEIAHEVYHADADVRPFDNNTRHFYSEVSMVGKKQPDWARGKRPVSLDRKVDPKRFRFYSRIA
jgi:hypothetical protein